MNFLFYDNLIYENDSIVVCVKPPKLKSELDPSGGNDIISALTEHYRSIGEKTTIYPVHRLDLGVGGIMVFAKSKSAAAALCAQIASRTVVKEYLAVVCGKPEDPSGSYRDLLFRDAKKNKSFVVDRARRGVKEALLDYKVLASEEICEKIYSLVHVRLHTGRTHQIRVQFSSRKMPLLGDRKYGGEPADEIALWSFRLRFADPTNQALLTCTALPEEGPICAHFDNLRELTANV